MTSLTPNTNDPDNLSLASGHRGQLIIAKYPTISFNLTDYNIPGINVGTAIQGTPYRVFERPREASFEDLQVTMLVDSKLNNWFTLFNWAVGESTPDDASQFTESMVYSDATLIVLTNKNNPSLKIKLENVFIKTLSGIEYNQGDEDFVQRTAIATFGFSSMKRG